MNDDPRSSRIDIAVSVHDAAWLDAMKDLEARARTVVRSSLEHLERLQVGGSGDALEGGPLEISLVFTDDAEQRALNRDYRHKDSATNVLSFSNMDEDGDLPGAGLPRLLGDVVLARETVAREAAGEGKSLSDHTSHLLVHGLLHLLGYDHQESDEAEEMESLETEILAALGIADPYADDDLLHPGRPKGEAHG